MTVQSDDLGSYLKWFKAEASAILTFEIFQLFLRSSFSIPFDFSGINIRWCEKAIGSRAHYCKNNVCTN